MATKVKPTRLQTTGTPQAWDVPTYVNADCFCRWKWWWVSWPSSSCDWDLAIFCGTCWDCIVDSWEKLCDYAKCCDIPTDNCQLANWCWYTTCTGTVTSSDLACYAQCCDMPNMSCYQQVCNLVCDLSWADDTHYPSAKAVADAIQSAWGWDMLKSVYDPNNCNADAFDYCNFSNTPDLNCYQEKLTAWSNITINANTISWDFNYAESNTAAACTIKCVCIPEITQLCIWQQITVKPTVTNTAGDTKLKLNWFTEYPIRYLNTALSTTSDWQVWWANCFATFLFDWSYWHVKSKSYDVNTTYTLNTLLDAWKYTAWTGTYALSRYTLVMEKDDWTWEKITDTSAAYSTATTKTVNTNWFRLNHIRYYNTSTNIATGGLIAANTLANQAASMDLRYSTNCWWTTTFAEWDYIYLVGTIKTDWLFYLDTTQWWTNQLPTTKDWKLYIRIWLCLAANWYTASFLVDRPIFYYDNGIKVYWQADNKQDLLVSWTNIKTVNWCSLLWSWDICVQWWVTSVNWCTWDVCLTIPTDNCELANGCWYTTCTWTLSTCSDITTALGYAPYSAANPCGYTTCTGTLQACDIADLAQCCDIPTDNCQLANWCGYTTCTGTLSSCADVISALWFTPYNCTNPAWYTTCTGTLTSADLACYAQCCDIPSVSWFVQESCIACVNWCCLTQWWDICIQGWGWIENLPWSPVCICYKWTGDLCAYCALGTYRCDTEYNVYQ